MTNSHLRKNSSKSICPKAKAYVKLLYGLMSLVEIFLLEKQACELHIFRQLRWEADTAGFSAGRQEPVL